MNAPTAEATLLAVTDTDGVAHLVTDDAVAAGHTHGRYVACCGAEVLPASLITPDRGHCRSCRQRRAGR